MGLEKAGLEVRKNALHLAAVRSSVGFQVVLVVKNPPANEGDIEMLVQSLGQEDPLEEGMATHSSVLAWMIHTVKGFGIVNKAEIDVFLVFDDPADVGNLISGSSAFSKTSLNIWKFTYC